MSQLLLARASQARDQMLLSLEGDLEQARARIAELEAALQASNDARQVDRSSADTALSVEMTARNAADERARVAIAAQALSDSSAAVADSACRVAQDALNVERQTRQSVERQLSELLQAVALLAEHEKEETMQIGNIDVNVKVLGRNKARDITEVRVTKTAPAVTQ